MGRLPNFERAEFDIRKIADYCLSPILPRGRHKARIFREVLGAGVDDASWLRETLLAALLESQAIELAADSYGVRWRVDIWVELRGRSAIVRTIWIIRTGEDVPRFVTCWVL